MEGSRDNPRIFFYEILAAIFRFPESSFGGIRNFRVFLRGILGRILGKKYPNDIGGTSGATLFRLGTRDTPICRDFTFHRIIEAYPQLFRGRETKFGKPGPGGILERMFGGLIE